MCPNSWYIKDKKGRIHKIGCGRCAVCRKSLARQWSLRLMHELTDKKVGLFVTLTYDDEHLKGPILPFYPTLCKEDLIKYLKRLRYYKLKFTYYAVGEYGDRTERPHYHALLFGVGMQDAKVIESCWKCGMVDVGIVEPKSIQYVTQYVRKKLSGLLANNEYEKCGRIPPFSVSSNFLGLDYAGTTLAYIKKNKCFKLNGHEVTIPRYYIKKGLVDLGFLASRSLDLVEESLREEISSGLSRDEFTRMKQLEAEQHLRNIIAKLNMFSKSGGF